LKIKIRLRVDGVLRPLVLSLLSTGASHPRYSIAELQRQVAALQGQRRSTCNFRQWRPGAFSHLYALVGAFWISWLAKAPWSSLRGMATTGICFLLLCFVLGGANSFRLWLHCRWPNVRLNRKVALLKVEIERLQNRDRLTL
jgi:hypothetical protein